MNGKEWSRILRKIMILTIMLSSVLYCSGCSSKKSEDTKVKANSTQKNNDEQEATDDTDKSDTSDDVDETKTTEDASVIKTYDEPEDPDILLKKYPNDYTCFRITTKDGVVIVTDPFCMNEKVKADIVTSSHTHVDHCDYSNITGKYKLFNSDGEYHVKGIDILGIPGLHDRVAGDPNEIDTTNLYKNYIFIYDINGIRVAEFGSQGMYPSDEMFKQMGQVDILILQIFNGGTKMYFTEIQKVIDKLQPKIIIPAHSGDKDAKQLAGIMELPVIYPPTVEIGITRKQLDDMKQSMIVLNNY